jgi:signal transduction histidine kinase
MRLELELLRLSRLADDEAVDQSGIRAAFFDLLTVFRSISATVPGNDSTNLPSHTGAAHDHLVELGAEFGVDAALATRPRQLGLVAMPTVLQKLWDRSGTTANGEATLAVEPEISRLLKLTAPLVRGEGRLNAAEREMVETFSLDHIRPMLAAMMDALDAEIDRTGQTVIQLVLGFSGLGILAALLSLAAIFRPLERAVMASQAEIISERDKAVAAEIAMRNILSAVSHELRTPMNGVLGFTSLLIASDLKSEHSMISCRPMSSKLISEP